MRKKIKKLWIKKLNSGEYPQTKKALRNDKGYCCLGVLCEVYSEIQKEGYWEKNFSFVTSSEVSKKTEVPESVLSWAGIDIDSTEKLIQMNDGGDDFKSIAKVIKKEL